MELSGDNLPHDISSEKSLSTLSVKNIVQSLEECQTLNKKLIKPSAAIDTNMLSADYTYRDNSRFYTISSAKDKSYDDRNDDITIKNRSITFVSAMDQSENNLDVCHCCKIAEKYRLNISDIESYELKSSNTSNDDKDNKKREEQVRSHEKKKEKKWLKVSANYNFYKEKKTEKLTTWIYEGISKSFKSLLWRIMLHEPEFSKIQGESYQTWKKEALLHSPVMDQIDKDIQRTFRTHPLFSSSYSSRSQVSLFNILVTYSYIDQDIGYTQGMNELAAVLVIYMTEEEAFWSLVLLINSEKLNLRGFYSDKLPLVKIFNEHIKTQLEHKYPVLSQHITNCGYDISIITTKWLMCLFAQSIPLEEVLRIWDVVIYEGSFVLIPLSLALLSYFKSQIINKDMDTISTFFRFETIEYNYNMNLVLQETRKIVHDFRKSGLKMKISKEISECCRIAKPLALKLVASFELKYSLLKTEESEDNIFKKPESNRLVKLIQINTEKPKTVKDPISEKSHSFGQNDWSSNLSHINEGISKQNYIIRIDPLILPQPRLLPPLPPPSVDPPELLRTFTQFQNSLMSFISQNQVEESKNRPSANSGDLPSSHLDDISPICNRIRNGSLTINDISRLIKYHDLSQNRSSG